MSSSLPPSPGAGPSSWREVVGDLADRLGTSVAVVLAGGATVAIVAVVLVAGWLREDPPPPEITIPYASAAVDEAAAPPASSGTSSTVVAAEVTVHVAGAVARPGVYVLAEPARVGDLLAVAGGPRPDADLDRLNLAAPVDDGTRVYVPVVGEVEVPHVLAPGGSSGGPDGAGPDGAGALVDVNTADVDTLESLPGVGPATAEAIVAHRERHGPFRRVEDLLDVRGIGDAKLAALRDLVVAGG